MDNSTGPVTLTAGKYTQTCGNTVERLRFAGRLFHVGYIAEGKTGRKVFQGPLVPGPWAFASPAATIISSLHIEPDPEVEVEDGQTVIIDGTAYTVRDRRKNSLPGELIGSHWLALDNAGPQVGEFWRELLVTDTRIYEVIARTAKTITLRTTRGTGNDRSEHRDGNPYPISYSEVGPDLNGQVYTLRLRKDGTYRFGDNAHPLRRIVGTPETVTDYRF